MFKVKKNNIYSLLKKFANIKIIREILKNSDVDRAYRTIGRLQNSSKKNISAFRIKIILLFSGIRLNIGDDNIYHLYNLIITDRSEAVYSRVFLEKALLNRNLNQARYKSWLRLRDIFYLKGEFILGGVCRHRALEFLSQGNAGLFLKRKNKARAEIEKSLYNKEFNNDTLNALLNFPYCDLEGELDKKIAKILNGKSIAIVGPSDATNNDAFEIDSYDVVVRLNYTQTGKGLDKRRKGVKIDVSYWLRPESCG